jgi:NAD(P)-dependent dehydrogenase (short-subunit alcohol dehydrogenase family)
MNAIAPHTVLITGAARRIGRAIALDLAAAGTTVAVHYNRSKRDAESVVAEIRARGGAAAAVRADLMDERATAAVIARAADAVGPIDCLINNASVFEEDNPRTATRRTWDTHMQVNVRAPLVLTQAFAAQLPKRREGHVINVIDQRVWNVTPYFTSYTVSKVALWGLTQNLALALAPGIRVNAIGPGPTLRSIHQDGEDFARQTAALLLKRGPDLAAFGRAVRYFWDEPSVTGQMLVLDGGQHLAWETPDVVGVGE